MGSKGEKLEEKILDLLSNQLLSVRQVARALGIKKHVASKILEKMKEEGKLQLFKVGKSYVYTFKKEEIIEPSTKTEKIEYEGKNLPEIIGVVSGKGGVGKTTVSLNLAHVLKTLGKDVIILDGDVRMCGVGLYLNMYNFPITMENVIEGTAAIENAIYTHNSGIKILPSALVAKSFKLKKLLKIFNYPALKSKTVLVDFAPGLEDNVIQFIDVCSKLIIVSTPDVPSLANAIKVAEIAERKKKEVLGIIINRRRKGDKTQITEEEIKKTINIPILGTIPEDYSIPQSMFFHSPVTALYPFSKSSIEFKKIGHKLMGFEYKEPSKLKAFIKNLIGRFR
jgi:septum site-determining protein MinD